MSVKNRNWGGGWLLLISIRLGSLCQGLRTLKKGHAPWGPGGVPAKTRANNFRRWEFGASNMREWRNRLISAPDQSVVSLSLPWPGLKVVHWAAKF
jgi:hypothetical protein